MATYVLNFCVAMQDFVDEKVKDEVLPEDEKEKFKVNINIWSYAKLGIVLLL